MDFLTASIIFFAALVELISWKLQGVKQAIIIDPGDNYLVWYYPLLSTITIWLFSLYFIIKSFRFNVCVYTIIVSVSYFVLQSIALSAFVFGFGLDMYELIAYPCILYGILSLTLIKVIRWFLA